jgi:type I restriction enzyme M protein
MLNKDKLNNLAQEIWKSADSLRGKFKSYEFQNVVLPMITIRRIECVLESWREEKLKELKQQFSKADDKELHRKLQIAEKQDFSFHNTSGFSLLALHHEDSKDLDANFVEYLKGFSSNINAIITHFNFRETLGLFKKSGRLGSIVKQYAELDLGLSVLSNLEMGYVYEELLRRFSEQSGGEAGEHFTPREVIRLMVELLDIQIQQQ